MPLLRHGVASPLDLCDRDSGRPSRVAPLGAQRRRELARLDPAVERARCDVERVRELRCRDVSQLHAAEDAPASAKVKQPLQPCQALTFPPTYGKMMPLAPMVQIGVTESPLRS